MSNFFMQKKIFIPIILIACMLLFIVVRLATRPSGESSESSHVTYTGDIDESGGDLVMIGIHIAGAVNEPGFLELPRGSRINDAIELAGGASYDAYLDGLNLAERVHDEMQIFVPRHGEMVPDGSGRRRINLNTATAAELRTLPGVGEVTAQNIIDLRIQMGGFRRTEDIMNVRGISADRFAEMRDLITVP